LRIPEHIIDQIRTQADIVDIIGEHVRLKRSGRNYLGLCPFHKEKTPSFNVNAERGMYKCFGCGKGGNVITFVQEHLHMPFPDAVKHLAAKMHIEIPEEEAADSEEVARREGARAALREAARFYQDTLTTSDGAPARAFFEKRGFSAEIIERFALGASPAAWDAATKHLLANGFTQDHLEDAGLVVVKEDGSVYDRFRGRAMFSIRDDAGRVVGFSARQIVDDPKSGKYINSPQSLLFDKSRVVYGLDLAKRAIMEARTAIIVEGQADVIAMHQAGFTSTVASSGTALTTEHLIRLKRYADTIVMVFDSDAAGQSAMTKGVELCLAAGLDARCVVLPQGEDPDSFLQGAGSDAMKKALADARPWLEWQTERYRLAGDLDDPVRHAAAVRTILTWTRPC
jgi:DNA primase